jgi:quinol monooxygenase YgiN
MATASDRVSEIADIDVIAGSEDAFEAAVAEAVSLFRDSPGCLSLSLHRSIESPSRFRLVVGWESVEAHTKTFRNSENYQQWRALVGPFFADQPKVQHYRKTAVGF